jgi:hypothetical protein
METETLSAASSSDESISATAVSLSQEECEAELESYGEEFDELAATMSKPQPGSNVSSSRGPSESELSIISKLTIKDIFNSIKEEKSTVDPLYHYWRQVEQLYFVSSDLENTINYYKDMETRFWKVAVEHCLDDSQICDGVRSNAFKQGSVNLARKLFGNQKELRKKAETVKSYLESRELYPKMHIEEVEKGFEDRIHHKSHVLNE